MTRIVGALAVLLGDGGAGDDGGGGTGVSVNVATFVAVGSAGMEVLVGGRDGDVAVASDSAVGVLFPKRIHDVSEPANITIRDNTTNDFFSISSSQRSPVLSAWMLFGNTILSVARHHVKVRRSLQFIPPLKWQSHVAVTQPWYGETVLNCP